MSHTRANSGGQTEELSDRVEPCLFSSFQLLECGLSEGVAAPMSAVAEVLEDIANFFLPFASARFPSFPC